MLIVLYPYNNREDSVSDSNLFNQLTFDINLQCLYNTNWSRRLNILQL